MSRPNRLRPQDAAIMRRIVDEGFGGSVVRTADALGAQPSAISFVLSGRYAIAPYLKKIRICMPYISDTFLETGEGDTGLLSVEQTVERFQSMIRDRDETIERLSKEIETQRRVIDMLLDERKVKTEKPENP